MDASKTRRVTVKNEWCKDCGICIAFCPRQALTANAQGKPVWNAETCVFCTLCELRCPDFAIYLEEVAASG